jgi:hypothetical protein
MPLGVRADLGRGFSEKDATPGNPLTMILLKSRRSKQALGVFRGRLTGGGRRGLGDESCSYPIDSWAWELRSKA